MINSNIIYVIVISLFGVFIGGGLYFTDESNIGLYILIFSLLVLVCLMIFRCIDTLFDNDDKYNDLFVMNNAIIPEESEVYNIESLLGSSYIIIEEEI